jgi:HlyD family secretion protein
MLWGVLVLLAAAAVAALASRLLPARVSTTTVARRDVARTLVLTGRVRPPARSRLGASIAGTVREVLVREGDHVARGQLLLRIDDAQAAASVMQASAALAQAEAQARSTVVQAERAFDQAERDLSRARTLLAQGAISTREAEVAQRTAGDARTELDAVRARVAGADAPLAEIARARGVLASARSQLALTRLTAPAAATVLARDAEPGDAVLPGQVLLELSFDGPTELVALAREENLGELKPGMAAVASADAYPAQSFPARVGWLAPVVDRAQGTVEVRLAVPAPPAYLRADMTVSINVEVARRAGALVVPRDVVHDAGTGAPWVAVASNGRAVRRDVRLGIAGERDVEIVSGLVEGDRVLPADVSPGTRVRITR